MVFWFSQTNSVVTLFELSILFGFGFAGVMTCLLICAREAAPIRMSGTAMAIVSTTAWIGMGIGSFQAGFFYDLQKSYVLSYGNAALAGIVNLLIVAALFWYRSNYKSVQARKMPALASHSVNEEFTDDWPLRKYSRNHRPHTRGAHQEVAPQDVNIFAKLEAFNPMGSVKDRLALGVIEAAERSGALKTGQTVVEATSGNTGIGLAMVCAEKGYPLVVTMAESFSIERRKLMRFLGAKVVLTPASEKGRGCSPRR